MNLESSFQFLINILASIIAGILLIPILGQLSQGARWLITGVLSRITNSDIDFVFPNKAASVKDVQKEIEKAKWVYIFTGRGGEFQRSTFASLFHHKPVSRNVKVKILLPQTQLSSSSGVDWTNEREKELKQFEKAFNSGRDLLKNQIEINVKFLEEYIDQKYYELKFYSFPHIGRIIITDKVAFYTPYQTDLHGKDSNVYKYKNGEMYDNYLRLFNQIWLSSKPYK